MIGARRVPYRHVLGPLLVLGLGLSLQPGRPMASQHGVFGRMNGADRQLADRALQETLESRGSGDLRLWRNDSTGSSGGIMPLRTFKIETGHFCREYRETAIANRKMDSRNLTACRSEGGIWITIE